MGSKVLSDEKTVIHFAEAENDYKQKIISGDMVKDSIVDAIVKCCKANSLPSYAPKNYLYFSIDTAEFYSGQGSGEPLQNMSDVITLKSLSYLSKEGMSNKLYIGLKESSAVYWDNIKKTYESLGSAGSGGVVSSDSVVEYGAANDFPTKGERGKIYLTRDNRAYRYDIVDDRYCLISDQGAFEKILLQIRQLGDLQSIIDKIANLDKYKVSQSQLADYRKRETKIGFPDLSVDLYNAIKNGTGTSPTTTSYDDTELKNQIADLKTEKADRTDLHNYRQDTVAIEKTDLSIEIQKKLDASYDDAAVRSDIAKIQQQKVDSKTLNNYRSKNVSITENDLDTELVDKINKQQTIGTLYDDTALKKEDARLDLVKMDKTVFDTFKTQYDTDIAKVKKDVSDAVIQVSNAQTDASKAISDVTILSGSVSQVEKDAAQAKADANIAGANASKAQQAASAAQIAADAAKTAVNAVAADEVLIKADIEQAKMDAVNAKTKAAQAAADASAATQKAQDNATAVDTINSQIKDILDRLNKLEPTGTTKIIDRVDTLSSITVDYGTKQEAIELPSKIGVTYTNGETDTLTVSWATTNYVATTSGTYSFVGSMTFDSSKITNPKDLKASQAVIVKAVIAKDILTISVIADIEVPFGTSSDKIGLPTTVNVTYIDNSTGICPVNWLVTAYNGTSTGTYNLKGNLVLDSEKYTNSKNLQASINIKVDAMVDPGSLFEWQYDFFVESLQCEAYLNKCSWWDSTKTAITFDDFYGIGADAESVLHPESMKVEVRFKGYKTADGVHQNIIYPDGALMPVVEDTDEVKKYKLSPDGSLDYDPATTLLSFSGGSLDRRWYIIRKIKTGYVKRDIGPEYTSDIVKAYTPKS